MKRPTASATEVSDEEFAYGRPLLQAKLERYQPRLVIFTFKKSAACLFGRFSGIGFVPGLRLGSAPVFVMPGPFEEAVSVERQLSRLQQWLASSSAP